jgi:hypothetical protein
MGFIGRAALLAIAIATAVVLAAPADAKVRKITHIEHATLGQVTARVTYQERRTKRTATYRGLRVRITRGSVRVLDALVAPPCLKGCLARPAGAGARRSVHVRNLDGDSEPEAIVDVYTGGAHCCDWAYVYDYVPAESRYALARRNFGDPGYRIDDLQGDGSLEFVGGDARFASAFTAYVFSGFPVQVWRFTGSGFANVTRSFPALVKRDARRFLRRYRALGEREDARGVLAAYAADQYLLGQGKVGLDLVRSAIARGEVSERFLDSLRRRLERWGYA